MNTEAQHREQIDAAEVWRAIGRLEGQQMQTNERLDRIEARLDRLFYLILGIGGAAIASIWITNLFGG
ncbi:MAG: hypothetical protein F4Y44_08095 [Chloroflexi bacterium]|nr:hypothetical protein [Chloroflexota bacterium]